MKIILYKEIVEYIKNNINNINSMILKNYINISSVIIGFLLFPITLNGIVYGLGFRVSGIISGSFASWFMSFYGRNIASGSLLSILQSIGAAGLSKFGILSTGIVGTFTINNLIKFMRNRFIKLNEK